MWHSSDLKLYQLLKYLASGLIGTMLHLQVANNMPCVGGGASLGVCAGGCGCDQQRSLSAAVALRFPSAFCLDCLITWLSPGLQPAWEGAGREVREFLCSPGKKKMPPPQSLAKASWGWASRIPTQLTFVYVLALFPAINLQFSGDPTRNCLCHKRVCPECEWLQVVILWDCDSTQGIFRVIYNFISFWKGKNKNKNILISSKKCNWEPQFSNS